MSAILIDDVTVDFDDARKEGTMRSTPLPSPRPTRGRTAVRWAGALAVGLALAACGGRSDADVHAGGRPPAAPGAVFAAEARRYVDLQLDRAKQAGASTDVGYRGAVAAELERYVDLQLDRARRSR